MMTAIRIGGIKTIEFLCCAILSFMVFLVSLSIVIRLWPGFFIAAGCPAPAAKTTCRPSPTDSDASQKDENVDPMDLRNRLRNIKPEDFGDFNL